MEVVLDRDAFLKGLQMVQNIVEPRQTLPILANVLLETEEGTVRLTATDLEVGARVSVPARVVGKGAITVSARKLAEIVKELPVAAIALKVGDSAGVSLRCAGVTYKLVGMPPDDFPPVVPASPGKPPYGTHVGLVVAGAPKMWMSERSVPSSTCRRCA